jgi:hypothetical protein
MDEEIRKKYFSFTIDKPKKPSVKKKKLPVIVKDIQNYTQKILNYSYEKSISYTQLSTFRNCQLKWSLRHKEGHYINENSIHTVFGTAMHETIQNYLNVMYNVSGVEADKIDLEKDFEERFRDTYLKEYKKNNNIHFSTSEEMKEFFDDGIQILKYFKSKRKLYFSKKNWSLVGCEVPLLINPNKDYKNVLYKGFLDIVLYHEPTNTIKIIDIKTSTYAWGKEKKQDENKQFQLILYKKLFAEQYNFPIDNIEIEFLIVKRKLYETEDFVIPRIQKFAPASGKIKISRAEKAMNSFIEDVFEIDGKFLNKEFIANPSSNNCRFCAFSKLPKLCPIGHKFL